MLFLIIGNLVVTYQLHCASIISHTCFYIPVPSVLLFFSRYDEPSAVCLFLFISCIIALSNTSFINVAFIVISVFQSHLMVHSLSFFSYV